MAGLMGAAAGGAAGHVAQKKMQEKSEELPGCERERERVCFFSKIRTREVAVRGSWDVMEANLS